MLTKIAVFLFFQLIQANNECTMFSSCELCAGQVDNNMSCRWCMENSVCVPSKYMCEPAKSVLHKVNCPQKNLPTNFNETFNRHELLYYIHAANRVASTSPVGAPMSCLLKINASLTVISEVQVNETIDGWNLGYLLVVNHDLKHIIVAFRSTNSVLQLYAQYFAFLSGWMEDFPLGGKMVGYYVNVYKAIVNAGFDALVSQTASNYPTYDIFVVGHSLGGALATIFSLHVAMLLPNRNVDLYSWSAPRSGDETFIELLNQHVRYHFRVVLDGDIVADMPPRVSETLPQAHHNAFEYYYPFKMDFGSYTICNQAESQFCSKGNWLKNPLAHVALFDSNLLNMGLGYCD